MESPNKREPSSTLEQSLREAFLSFDCIKGVSFSGKVFRNEQTETNPDLTVEADEEASIPSLFSYFTANIPKNNKERRLIIKIPLFHYQHKIRKKMLSRIHHRSVYE